MNKQEKANKVMGYLSLGDSITADTTQIGNINYRVKGVVEPIYTDHKWNVTDSYRYVARRIIESGVQNDRCREILIEEEEELLALRRRDDQLASQVSALVDASEMERISKLTEEEKMSEISERYGIEVIDYRAAES